MMEPKDSIRVVIAEERRVLREGLRRILDQEEGITIVGETADARQTIEVVGQLQPDVVLLGLSKVELDGVEIIGLLKHTSPNTKQLIFAASADCELALKHLKAGANGYLTKDAGVSELIKAIHALTQGELWVERKMFAQVIERELLTNFGKNLEAGQATEPLSPREQEVLDLLSTGKTNKEIARILTISEKTVKSHLNKIFRKLRVHHRLQAALHALKPKL